jgi:hypothetical protein
MEEPQQPVTYIPGDTIAVPINDFVHEMNLKAVVAHFGHETTGQRIELRGEPSSARRGPGGDKSRGPRISRVTLKKNLGPSEPHGRYRCQGVWVETFGDAKIPFDEITAPKWRQWEFYVLEEPNTPPRF